MHGRGRRNIGRRRDAQNMMDVERSLMPARRNVDDSRRAEGVREQYTGRMGNEWPRRSEEEERGEDRELAFTVVKLNETDLCDEVRRSEQGDSR
jgi:hypothetical protein